MTSWQARRLIFLMAMIRWGRGRFIIEVGLNGVDVNGGKIAQELTKVSALGNSRMTL